MASDDFPQQFESSADLCDKSTSKNAENEMALQAVKISDKGWVIFWNTTLRVKNNKRGVILD